MAFQSREVAKARRISATYSLLGRDIVTVGRDKGHRARGVYRPSRMQGDYPQRFKIEVTL